MKPSAPNTGAPDTCSLSHPSDSGGHPQSGQLDEIKVTLQGRDIPWPGWALDKPILALLADGCPPNCIISAATDVPVDERIPALWLRDNLAPRAKSRWQESVRRAESEKLSAIEEAKARAEAEVRLAEIERRNAEEAALVAADPFI